MFVFKEAKETDVKWQQQIGMPVLVCVCVCRSLQFYPIRVKKGNFEKQQISIRSNSTESKSKEKKKVGDRILNTDKFKQKEPNVCLPPPGERS